MIDRMLELLKGQSMCVLATSDGEEPYCSLMAYVTDRSGRTVYMVTLADSRKYRNVVRNARVSLLIDTRQLHPSPADRGLVQALTVQGECSTIEDAATREELLGRIVATHPQTGELTRHTDARVLAVRVKALLLLDGVNQAHYEVLS